MAFAAAAVLAGCGGGGGGGGDATAPAAIADLSIVETTIFSFTLSWTAPGDDGTDGTAAAYEVRCSVEPITKDNWDTVGTVYPLDGEPVPATAGTTQTFVAWRMNPAQHLYFAVKTRDEASNWSALSNVPDGTTIGAELNESFNSYTEDEPLPSPWTLVAGSAATVVNVAQNDYAPYLSAGSCHYIRNAVATAYPVIAADLRWAANDICQYGLYARYIDLNNHYQLLIDKTGGTLVLFRVKSGGSANIGSAPLPFGYDYTAQHFLEFKLEDAGSGVTRFKGYIDGQLLLTVLDSEVTGAGTVGFLIVNGGAYVDDFFAHTP